MAPRDKQLIRVEAKEHERTRLPIIIYGSHTCEDTAVARGRLNALQVPFIEHDYEDDAYVAERIEAYNNGSLRTPTIVFGQDEVVLTEPSIQQLEEAVKKAGYEIRLPSGVKFDPAVANRPAPDFRLPSARGMPFELHQLRGSRRSVLFFAHGHRCLACRGFAKQLAARVRLYEEMEALVIIVLRDNREEAHLWAEEFAPGVEVLADADESVKRRYIGYFGVLNAQREGTLLLVLDRFTAPRVGAYAPDAGGLLSPQETADWLQWLDFECDE